MARGRQAQRACVSAIIKADRCPSEQRELTRLVLLTRSAKHSSFASTFPIYLETSTTVTRPISPLESAKPASPASDDDDEAEIEEEEEVDTAEPETEEVEEVAYERLNSAEPLWMRDPKKVTKEEYEAFYKATSKDSVGPLSWSHFK